ncbi:MAG: COR domain-containing protein [Candidatus Hodarchaeota archaeon]
MKLRETELYKGERVYKEELAVLEELESLTKSSWEYHIEDGHILVISSHRLHFYPSRKSQRFPGGISRELVSNTDVKTIPDSIGKLKKLKWLILSNTALTTLPDAVSQLTNLKYLNLSRSKLTTLPDSVGQLTNLRKLYLAGTKLTTLPDSVGQLTNLEELSLAETRLKTLPDSLGQLTQLRVLFLSRTELTTLPDFLGQLTNLTRLYLSEMELTTLPDSLKQLIQLERLDLERTELTMLPNWLGQLVNLERLDLSGVELTALPESLSQLEKLEELKLPKTLEVPPPEVIAQGIKAIQAFLRERARSRRYQAKIVLVGEGGVGKTSLMKTLLERPFDTQEEATLGIEVIPFNKSHPEDPSKTLNYFFWDFAGQDIYFSTHEFYMTLRSIYLLVWNGRGNVQQGNLEYWLELITLRAPQMPIFLIATHLDELADRTPQIDFPYWKERYPMIQDFIALSNKTRDLQRIQSLIVKLIVCSLQLKHMGEFWPDAWLHIEKCVKNWGLSKSFMPANTFEQDCFDYLHQCNESLSAPEEFKTVAKVLHHEGAILYYPEERSLLKDLVVLQPNWVSKQIAEVMRHPAVEDQKGLIQKTLLTEIWDSQEFLTHPNLRDQLFLLMVKFNLCYQYEPDTVLIPLFLENIRVDFPSSWTWRARSSQDSLFFVYEFETALPKGLFPSFIVRTRRFTIRRHWKTGVYLQDAWNQALVEYDPHKYRVTLKVGGLSQLAFLIRLQEVFEDLFHFYQGLTVTRLYQCICEGKRTDYNCDHYFKETTLAIYAKKKKIFLDCQSTANEVPLASYAFSRPYIDKNLQNQFEEILNRIEGELTHIRQQLDELTEDQKQLIQQSQQYFIQLYHKLTPEFPNVFYFVPTDSEDLDHVEGIWERTVEILFICQMPNCWHPIPPLTPPNTSCHLRLPKDIVLRAVPWINRLIRIAKTIVPLGTAVWQFVLSDEHWNNLVKSALLLKETTRLVPQFEKFTRDVETIKDMLDQEEHPVQKYEKEALKLLQSQIPKECFEDVIFPFTTSDGQYIWVCADHREQLQQEHFGL